METPALTVDHLVFTAPDLASGCDIIEELLGVRPVTGGRHQHWGTHNALLSLGERSYFEVVAPDPALPRPKRGRWMELFYGQRPRLATWVVATSSIDAVYRQAIAAGIPLGKVAEGSREKPDGSTLRWRLTDPYALPMGGSIPFLIDWGDTPHPGGSLPVAGRLEALSVGHSDPKSLENQLKILGAEPDVYRASAPSLRAQIITPSGRRVVIE